MIAIISFFLLLICLFISIQLFFTLALMFIPTAIIFTVLSLLGIHILFWHLYLILFLIMFVVGLLRD